MIARIDVRRSLRIVGDRDWFIVEAVRIVVGKSGTRLIRIVFSPLNYAKFCNFARNFPFMDILILNGPNLNLLGVRSLEFMETGFLKGFWMNCASVIPSINCITFKAIMRAIS